MDTVETLQKELEKCVNSINSTGPGSMDLQNIEKLDKMSIAAAELGMKQGKQLIDNLSAVIKSYKEGNSKEDSVSIRLTAIDFYLKNTLGGDIEEL
jgi:hypothetical protein